MTYHHTGIPVFEKMDGMVYMDALKVWISDAGANPYKVEFLYFEPDSPMAAAIQDDAHVAYVVDNIAEAVKGKSVLWPVMQAMPGLKIAFIHDRHVTVELMQLG
jgi:hypothetical protein